jgi:hypothetical protein
MEQEELPPPLILPVVYDNQWQRMELVEKNFLLDGREFTLDTVRQMILLREEEKRGIAALPAPLTTEKVRRVVASTPSNVRVDWKQLSVAAIAKSPPSLHAAIRDAVTKSLEEMELSAAAEGVDMLSSIFLHCYCLLDAADEEVRSRFPDLSDRERFVQVVKLFSRETKPVQSFLKRHAEVVLHRVGDSSMKPWLFDFTLERVEDVADSADRLAESGSKPRVTSSSIVGAMKYEDTAAYVLSSGLTLKVPPTLVAEGERAELRASNKRLAAWLKVNPRGPGRYRAKRAAMLYVELKDERPVYKWMTAFAADEATLDTALLYESVTCVFPTPSQLDCRNGSALLGSPMSLAAAFYRLSWNRLCEVFPQLRAANPTIAPAGRSKKSKIELTLQHGDLVVLNAYRGVGTYICYGPSEDLILIKTGGEYGNLVPPEFSDTPSIDYFAATRDEIAGMVLDAKVTPPAGCPWLTVLLAELLPGLHRVEGVAPPKTIAKQKTTEFPDPNPDFDDSAKLIVVNLFDGAMVYLLDGGYEALHRACLRWRTELVS